MLDEGVHATLGDLAKAKGVNATYVSRVVGLKLLAPDIPEAILDGRQRVDLQLDDLLMGFSAAWQVQRLRASQQRCSHRQVRLYRIWPADPGRSPVPR